MHEAYNVVIRKATSYTLVRKIITKLCRLSSTSPSVSNKNGVIIFYCTKSDNHQLAFNFLVENTNYYELVLKSTSLTLVCKLSNSSQLQNS